MKNGKVVRKREEAERVCSMSCRGPCVALAWVAGWGHQTAVGGGGGGGVSGGCPCWRNPQKARRSAPAGQSPPTNGRTGFQAARLRGPHRLPQLRPRCPGADCSGTVAPGAGRNIARG